VGALVRDLELAGKNPSEFLDNIEVACSLVHDESQIDRFVANRGCKGKEKEKLKNEVSFHSIIF